MREKTSSLPDNGEVKETEFKKLINNDLDTPKALALVYEILKDDNLGDAHKKATILDMDRVLGLNLNKVETFVIPEEIQKLVEEREKAREEKDYAKSDELRDKAKADGYEIKDTEDGPSVSPSPAPEGSEDYQ